MKRDDYMSGKVTHEEYYRSVNKTAGLDWSDHSILPKVRAALADGDHHLNKIPLAWWDLQGANPWIRSSLQRALKEHGDFMSLAGIVCCLKQAARDAVEDEIPEMDFSDAIVTKPGESLVDAVNRERKKPCGS